MECIQEKIVKNYKFNGLSELISTGGPGEPDEAFMKIIRIWPHYELAYFVVE